MLLLPWVLQPVAQEQLPVLLGAETVLTLAPWDLQVSVLPESSGGLEEVLLLLQVQHQGWASSPPPQLSKLTTAQCWDGGVQKKS